MHRQAIMPKREYEMQELIPRNNPVTYDAIITYAIIESAIYPESVGITRPNVRPKGWTLSSRSNRRRQFAATPFYRGVSEPFCMELPVDKKTVD